MKTNQTNTLGLAILSTFAALASLMFVRGATAADEANSGVVQPADASATSNGTSGTPAMGMLMPQENEFANDPDVPQTSNLGELQVLTIESMLQASEQAPAAQGKTYQKAAKLYKRMAQLASKRSTECNALSESLKREYQGLKTNNQEVAELVKQMSTQAEEVRRELDEVKQRANKARELVKNRPNSPLAKAESTQAFREKERAEAQAREFEALFATAIRPAEIGERCLRDLNHRVTLMSAAATSYKIAAATYTANGKMLGLLGNAVSQLGDMTPEDPVEGGAELSSLAVKGPKLTPEEERRYNEWLNEKPAETVKAEK